MFYKYSGMGKKCPGPLVQLRLMMKEMCGGDRCIVTLNDSGSIKDITKLLKKKGYHYCEQSIGEGIVQISIKAC